MKPLLDSILRSETFRDGKHGEAVESDHGLEIHLKISSTPGEKMREGRESREIEGEKGHRERQHGRRQNLRRELHPQAHRTDELSPPRFSSRRRRGSSRHPGQNDHH